MSTNIRVKNIGPNPFIEDEKRPARLIKSVDKTERKDTFQITIFHPNKTKITRELQVVLRKYDVWTKEIRKAILKEESIDIIFDKVNVEKNIMKDLKKQFKKKESIMKEDYSLDILYSERHRATDLMAAMDKASDIVNSMFSNIVTDHEDIKHIYHGKKGKMKLKTKKTK